jgi:hypothetical protein
MPAFASALAFLKGPKGLLKAATGLALVLGIGWFAWDYLDAKEDAATLADRVRQWQGRAEAWEQATRVQEQKALRAQRANRNLRATNEALRERRGARERDYQREVKDDPKAQKWGVTGLPAPVRSWLRDLAGRTPGVGAARRAGPAGRDAGAGGLPPAGSGAPDAGGADE